MSVKRGKVVERQRYIDVEGERLFVPKECDPIIGPQLEALAEREIEVLMAQDTVLAIRPIELEPEIEIPPIILCYLVPLAIAFEWTIMRKIQPLITESLLESGYLDKGVVQQLHEWQEQA
jgi:hypothetical protein